tara:strand:+ start:994 stop:1296 length:303 start_codon:yes stop_codon:yes gene_type:complete
MNRCHFLGKLLSPPTLAEYGGAVACRFILEVEEYRRNKDGTKTRRTDELLFEAWDSGGKTISRHANEGDLLAVEALARNESKRDKSIVFRVTNFKIIPRK